MTLLATQALTALMSANVEPSNSASSPPRDGPHTARKPSPSQVAPASSGLRFRIFERDIDQASRQPGLREIGQVERRIAVRCEHGAGVLVNAASATVEHQSRGMRARAGRQRQDADNSVAANGRPRNARSGGVSSDRQLFDRSPLAPTASRWIKRAVKSNPQE